MQKKSNLVGDIYGQLTVIKEVEPKVYANGQRRRRYECLCTCGNTKIVAHTELRSGDTKSCGCHRKKFLSELKTIKMIGKKYGRWTVIDEAGYRTEPSGAKIRLYTCQCECGEIRDIVGSSLRNGSSQSCGCLNSELSSERLLKHGLTNHPLYLKWSNMKRRCYDENNCSYDDYGGRGIKVCKEWIDGFKSFYDWAMENGWKKGLELDRIDTNGNYSPKNCRFITHQRNSVNRRKFKNNKTGYKGVYYNKKRGMYTVFITIKGENIYLGGFTSKAMAVRARNRYIRENKLQADYKLQPYVG